MAYDLEPLRSYVRFYLTVTAQLTQAWGVLTRSHETIREELSPFAEALAPVQSAALSSALGPTPCPPPVLAELWAPQDPQGLTALTDVYEVVGRFTFQGDDNENLARVQAVVSSGRNEVHAQRSRLAELAQLPSAARACADKLGAEEARQVEGGKASKLAAFAPLTQQLYLRARQTMEAVKAVPLPDTANTEASNDEYRKYVVRADQVYQTCLPFLRKALADMYAFAGCEVPASWPDSLPFQRELPADLVWVPPLDSPELRQAQTGVAALDEENRALCNARDEVAVNLARLEAEINAHVAKETELRAELETAGLIVNLSSQQEQLQQTHSVMAQLEQQKAQRMMTIGNFKQRHQEIETAILALEQELKHRTAEIGQAGQNLAVERDNEPAIFGKDAWRQRVADAEQEIDRLRGTFAQRQGVLNQLKIDQSALVVQVQTEDSQSALIDKWIQDTKSKQSTLQTQVRDLENRLSHARPGRQLSVIEAEEFHAAQQARRVETLERIERLKADMRRNKEDQGRVLARLKQIEVERQQVGAMKQSADIAATQGRDAAIKQLAARRRAAVEQHAADVLGGLEKSLLTIDSVFVDPAREAMLKDDRPRVTTSQVVRENAEKVATIIEGLVARFEPAFLDQDAMLGHLQREFCDKVSDSCRNAW